MSMRLTATMTNVEQRWASIGDGGSNVARLALAHVRMIRPTTRLWLDTLMPIAVLAVATGGPPPLLATVLFVLTMNLIHIGATIFNDLSDIEIDKISSEPVRRQRPIAQGVISVRLARIEAITAVLLGIAASFVLSIAFGAVITFLAVVTLLHEIPPVRVQGRTVIAQLYTTIGLAILIGALVLLVPQPRWATAVPFGIYVVLYLGLCETLVKDIRDVDNDAEGGKLTTAVKFGSPRATAAAAAAYLLTGIAWLSFAVPFGILNGFALFGTVVFVLWIGYVANAARRLRREFSKPLVISLHKGSALVFSVLNASALIANVS